MSTARQKFFGVLLVGIGFAAGSLWSLYALAQRSPAAGRPRPVSARGALTPDEMSVTALFHRASPSVVYITSKAVRRDFFSLNVLEIPQGTGSGFVWDSDGHVVTNFHVLRSGSSFEVTLADQSTWPATPVGGAPEKDLAVLKIDAPQDRFRPIDIGTSNDLLVGQTVLAIGNPFGFDQTLTTGIIIRPRAGDRVDERSAYPGRDSDRRGDQPGQLGRSAAGQRRPADRRQRRHRQSPPEATPASASRFRWTR